MTAKSLHLKFSLYALLLHFTLEVSAVTYVRWGRTTCNSGAEVVYKGYMAGSHYTSANSGNGANYLCVHEHPKPGPNNVPGSQPVSGYLVGIEYEVHSSYGYGNNRPFSYRNVGGRDLHDQEAVCVVCQLTEKYDVLMIPGRPDCGRVDWHVEYTGYLMSERQAHHRSEFICVDEAPEARFGGEGNHGGGIYPVQEYCGSLPCPPFVEGNEVACAVCSN